MCVVMCWLLLVCCGCRLWLCVVVGCCWASAGCAGVCWLLLWLLLLRLLLVVALVLVGLVLLVLFVVVVRCVIGCVWALHCCGCVLFRRLCVHSRLCVVGVCLAVVFGGSWLRLFLCVCMSGCSWVVGCWCVCVLVGWLVGLVVCVVCVWVVRDVFVCSCVWAFVRLLGGVCVLDCLCDCVCMLVCVLWLCDVGC